MTSDQAFEAFRREKKECFDFIFIDGLHLESQVLSLSLSLSLSTHT
jgi:predicted O-methyltransferase YrrM